MGCNSAAPAFTKLQAGRVSLYDWATESGYRAKSSVSMIAVSPHVGAELHLHLHLPSLPGQKALAACGMALDSKPGGRGCKLAVPLLDLASGAQ